jgi:transcription antitermination factor NusG
MTHVKSKMESSFNIDQNKHDLKWYVIYVKNRHEKSVLAELQNKGIEASLPLMTVTREWSDRKKIVEIPWFRGYVFVRINLNYQKFNVLETQGVVRFVPMNNRAIPVPDEQLYWLQKMVSMNRHLKHETNLPIGAKIKVCYGPLKGLSGQVEQQHSSTRIIVWFEAIMQGTSVEIDPAWVTKEQL